ncbi:MAG: type II toxin-antitoxin system PemK/MazF family toxin, partial [Candidatus Rokubacteria bacterium]|nr:type II toxin-antitoxin system PemK/MazF family toxin [Candidatus Rokubacteria bacterium]
MERYGIYLADLDPTRGREIAKTRPVVVVSLDAEVGLGAPLRLLTRASRGAIVPRRLHRLRCCSSASSRAR